MPPPRVLIETWQRAAQSRGCPRQEPQPQGYKAGSEDTWVPQPGCRSTALSPKELAPKALCQPIAGASLALLVPAEPECGMNGLLNFLRWKPSIIHQKAILPSAEGNIGNSGPAIWDDRSISKKTKNHPQDPSAAARGLRKNMGRV